MLNKVIICLFLICADPSMRLLQAQDLNGDTSVRVLKANESISPESSKKYNLSICAIMKNDAKSLKEWLEYHRNVGVDHFYLYDVASTDSYQTVLGPYLKEGIVTLVNWPEMTMQNENCDASTWALSTQIPAYENAVNFLAREETNWLVLVDLNEFLVCSDGTMADILKKYNDYSGITLATVNFDEPMLDTMSSNKRLTKSLDLKPIAQKSVTKMIFKPSQSAGFAWAPYECRFKSSDATTEVSSKEVRIDRYVKRNNVASPMKKALTKNAKANKSIDYNSLSESDFADLVREEATVHMPSKSIYPVTPDFLKKLMSEQQE